MATAWWRSIALVDVTGLICESLGCRKRMGSRALQDWQSGRCVRQAP
jgi:hypothetical protein